MPPVELTDDVVRIFLANTRNPDERRGDLRAQIAAHRLAERRLGELVERRGVRRVEEAMDELYAYSERVVRAAIARLPDGRGEATDVLETVGGDLELRVAVEIRGETVEIDFSGSAPQHAGNLNCPLSVTRSACFLVVRCLTEPDVPASGGAFEPVTVLAPPGSPRERAAARGRGRRQRRDLEPDRRSRVRRVLELFPVPAQGQGTVNNLTFGNGRFTYYETIGGGQGACPEADGPSGVHVAISNTLTTPVEALELAYPLRVERYALRLGSGGEGAHRGGNGVVRTIRVLEDCRCSLLTDRRAHAPRGAAGGGDGQPGRNLRNGEPVPAKTTLELAAGDTITVETPGGGGYGPAATRTR